MYKIAEIWGLNFDTLATELRHSTDNVNGIILDFLCEVEYKLKHPSFYEILDIAYRDNIPVTILTPYLREMPPLLDFNDPKYKDIKMIHWETFWFNRTYAAWKPHESINKHKCLDMFNTRNGEQLTNFKYPYITLNNIAKYHRCLVMDLLAKHNLIDKGAIAWRDILRSCDDVRHTFPPDMTDSMYTKYPYRYWKPKRMILDQSIDERFFQETLPFEFTESFMQLVTESDESVVFFSEKTATPILLNKLFLVASSPYHHTALKNRGFQLYDEIFDYGFDTELDDALRFEGLIENIKRISSMSLSELQTIHKNIFDKLVYNKQHAVKLATTVPDEVLKIIDGIKRENKDPYYGPLNIFL